MLRTILVLTSIFLLFLYMGAILDRYGYARHMLRVQEGGLSSSLLAIALLILPLVAYMLCVGVAALKNLNFQEFNT